ncbi:hypothetical protein C0V73_09785 [Rhizobium sp. TH135]|uniref:hypothetical protein n=1 Tax=Rhizobium sp. TH135 TaxID=2067451 RepID=UPI000C7AFEA3|nr:hypothetical protein [Rhizobium sp. TH135]PLK70909.1 hypothetical protein C0V73_09785 [Rhizobium sp. TH135]
MTTEEHNAPSLEGFGTLPADLPWRDPADILKVLGEVKATGRDDPAKPDRINPNDLLHIEALFQARGAGEIDNRHVESLHYTLTTGDDLRPISVWRCGGSIILLDGHHRVKAYKLYRRRTGKPVTIPVSWFEGTPQDALAFATGSHLDIKLPLTSAQRSNHAWMLVCLGIYSKQQESKLTGLPTSTIGNMRKVRKELLKADQTLPSAWNAALSLAKGRTWKMDLDWEDVVEQKAKEYADRIQRAVGPQFFKNTEIMAATIEKLCPGRVEDIIRLLSEGDLDGFTDDEEEADF